MSTTMSIAQKRRELARKEKQDIQAKSGRRERPVRVPDGRSKWRVLPSWRGAEDPSIGHSWGQHFVRDASGELQAVHMCLDKTYGKDCPICNSIKAGIKNSTNDDVQKVLEEAKATSRFLVNALNLGSTEPNKPVILELAPTVYEKLMDLVDQWGDEEFGEVDIVDLETGHDIIITKTGKGLTTKYDVAVSPKGRREDPSVMANVHDLDAYVKQEHEETQLKALNNIDKVVTGLPSPSAADEDFDDILDGEFEEEEPAPKKKAPAVAAKPAPKAAVKRTPPPAEEEDELDDILGELEDLDL